MFLPDLKFHSSYTAVQDCPAGTGVRVVAFTGRSNSGKSSLISALANHRNLARVSAQPGKTRLINYFHLAGSDFSKHEFYLVDLPGYGFAKMPQKERQALRKMLDEYLAQCPGLALLILVLDARRNPGEEEKNILAYCKAVNLPLLFVRSKWDKLNQKDRQKCKKEWKAQGLLEISYPVSSLKKTGISEVTRQILRVFQREVFQREVFQKDDTKQKSNGKKP